MSGCSIPDPTNATFSIQACAAPVYPVIIPLTNGIPFVVASTTDPNAAPPGPPQLLFFDFLITNSVPGVLFELYNLSGNADLVLQRDVPPTMTPYFGTSFFTGTTPEQIVLRTNSALPASYYAPDLRGHWYLGLYNNEQVQRLLHHPGRPAWHQRPPGVRPAIPCFDYAPGSSARLGAKLELRCG